jgi:hypothetical protein
MRLPRLLGKLAMTDGWNPVFVGMTFWRRNDIKGN